jgi:hypothetical protein
MGLHQIKNLLPIKETITRVKRQLREWEKSFWHLFYRKRINTKNIQQIPKTKHQKNTIPMNNVQVSGTVFRNTKGNYIYVEMFDILSYKEMQIKITLGFLLTPVRVAVIKKQTWLEGCGEQEPLYAAHRNVSKYNHYENQYGDSSEN